MRIPLLYRGEYSQWRERFMNYLEVQTDGKAMINSIQNGDHPLPVIAQVSLAGTAYQCPLLCVVLSICDIARKSIYSSMAFKAMRKNKCLKPYSLLTIWYTGEGTNQELYGYQHYALYNHLKQNQGDVNDAMGYKKKAVVVTSDPLALVADKTKVSKRKEKVVVQSESEGSDNEDISDLKKITVLLAKAFNQKKYYAKPTNNNLRTSSASSLANKKPEYVKSEEKKEDKKADEKKRDMSKVKCYNCKKEGHFAKDCKKAKVKDYNYYKTKMLLAKKDSDEKVLLAEDQAWMESSSDSDQDINANMVFMAKMEKVLSDSEESSLSTEETIAKISYYINLSYEVEI
ncbi:nucleolar protein 58-like protein [Tanacetum coccineum]